MNLHIGAITFDCSDAPQLAEFWSAATGRPVDPGNEAMAPFFASIGRSAPDGQPALLFIKVPEGKTAKNRVHLDLHTTDRAGEVDRLVALGATIAHDKDEWNTRWTTLLDPEGNEFCVAQD